MDHSEFEAEIQRSIEPYRIAKGAPSFPVGSTIRSFDDAVKRLRESLGTEFDFDVDKVVEAETWWYIPFIWLGCAGYIVDKIDGYINQLGSCHPLDLCFWAHEQNIKHKYSDLTVTRVGKLPETVAAIKKMGNRSPINPIPNKSDSDGNRTKFLSESEIEIRIASLPATFRNQVLWFTIPALKKACDNEEFEFVVSRGSWDSQPVT